MGRMRWLAYLWPGLTQLWHRGTWSALVLAVGFGVLLDLELLANWVWVELLSPAHLKLGWLAVGALWAVSTALSIALAARTAATPLDSSEALFREALSEYLQGNWFEAQTTLGRLLRLDPRDAEGRLLLATLLRHSGRTAEARDQLDRLERLRDAAAWSEEIASERQAIAERARSGVVDSDSAPLPENPIEDPVSSDSVIETPAVAGSIVHESRRAA